MRKSPRRVFHYQEIDDGKNHDRLAELLGAKIVGQVSDVGGGVFGMARLAQLLH